MVNSCGVRFRWPNRLNLIQNAATTGGDGALVFFAFDLLFVDGGTS